MAEEKMQELSRKMIYPQTLFQKVKHFPYKFYWKHTLLYRYFVYSIFVAMPVMYQLQKLSYHPANVQKYEAYLERQKKEVEHHKHWLEKFHGEGGH